MAVPTKVVVVRQSRREERNNCDQRRGRREHGERGKTRGKGREVGSACDMSRVSSRSSAARLKECEVELCSVGIIISVKRSIGSTKTR